MHAVFLFKSFIWEQLKPSFQAIWLASSCQETNAISKHVFENKMFSKNIYRSGILHDPFSWKGASLTILMMNRTVTWL